MDYSVAEMSCVLNSSVQCEACKAKVYEILQNIYGVYTISMDAEEGTVKISGRVNPRTFLRVLENSGKHAEVKSMRFDGEVVEKRYYPYGEAPTSYDHPYPHPLLDCPEHPPYSDRTYNVLPFPPPPPPLPPPSYPWQFMPPPPPPAPWAMPMWRPPLPLLPPPYEASNEDSNHKCCRVM